MLVVGLVCGAILTALYQGYQENAPGGFGSGIRSLLEKEPEPVQTTEAPDTAPEPAPKVKLDYHEVLPNIDQVLSESELVEDREQEAAEDSRETAVEEPPDQRYILQAGSFRSDQDAESMKARLALAGFEAVIQRVNIESKGTYFRVRMGPYDSKRKLQVDRRRLAGLGINALALRLEQPQRQ